MDLAVAAGLALWSGWRWAAPLAVTIALATVLVFAAFGVHVLTGGAYEPHTVGAMALRTLAWAAIAWIGARAGPPAAAR